MKKIIIQGFYGRDNLGDDYILYSLLNTINKAGKYEVYVLTGDKDCSYIFERFNNIKCYALPENSFNKFTKLKFLIKCDYFIIGGGGLYPSENDETFPNLLKLVRIVKSLKTKIVFYGIDINSIDKPQSKEAWVKISQIADFILLRNKRSAEMLKEIGCKNVYKSSDITFALTTPHTVGGGEPV